MLQPRIFCSRSVRTGESNLGNFIGDVWRDACSADVALLNGGTLRSSRCRKGVRGEVGASASCTNPAK